MIERSGRQLRPLCCAMPTDNAPRLYRWLCSASAARGRMTCKHDQQNWCMVNRCGCWKNFSSPRPPTEPALLTSSPGCISTSGSSKTDEIRLRLQELSHVFLRQGAVRGACKTRTSAHTRSSTGVIRPIQSRSMAVRQQYPPTA